MLTSIEDTYRNGQIVLREPLAQVQNEMPVIVTFIGSDEIELWAQGIVISD